MDIKQVCRSAKTASRELALASSRGKEPGIDGSVGVAVGK